MDIDIYWLECIKEALLEAELIATKEQVNIIASIVEGAAQAKAQATGEENIPNPEYTELKDKIKKLEKERDDYNKWVNSTKPCLICGTTGLKKDVYGRKIICNICDGKGRL